MVGAIGGAVAIVWGTDATDFRWWALFRAFVVGVLLSEVIDFARHVRALRFLFRYENPKQVNWEIGKEAVVMATESISISVIGCIALYIAASVMPRRSARRTKE